MPKHIVNKVWPGGCRAQEGHGSWCLISRLPYRRNVGFWCELCTAMQVGEFESAVKKTLRALHVCLLLNELLQTIAYDYFQDALLYIGGRKYVLRAIMESGLWSCVGKARRDIEAQRLL